MAKQMINPYRKSSSRRHHPFILLWICCSVSSIRHWVDVDWIIPHTTGKPMKEVTWVLLCLCTNGHRSAALARQPFILPPVFVQAAVIRSWQELIRPVCSLMRSIKSFHNRLILHHWVISQEVINTETRLRFQFLVIFSVEFRYSFFLYQYVGKTH